jgi:hypothetical protein
MSYNTLCIEFVREKWKEEGTELVCDRCRCGSREGFAFNESSGEYSCFAMYRLMRNVRVLLCRGSIHIRVLVERRWKERKRFLLTMCFGLAGTEAGRV